MIILITYMERFIYDRHGQVAGKKTIPQECVSHGGDSETLENVCLCQESLTSYIQAGAYKLNGDWVMT